MIITGKVLKNAVIGFFMYGILTILVDTYKDTPTYLNITAFPWAAPLFFLFMMYITRAKGKEILMSFVRHAGLGTLVTILVFGTTMYLAKLPMPVIAMVDTILILTFLILYFCLGIYKL